MRIAAIKELVSRYSIDELIQAEEALLEERGTGHRSGSRRSG